MAFLTGLLRRASETNPRATIPIQKIPRFIPHTNPTPPDESNTTGQVFFRIRMNPTSPGQSDRLQPPHNPSVVGSIPTGPTKWFWPQESDPRIWLIATCFTEVPDRF
jgi:hypothetical protein